MTILIVACDDRAGVTLDELKEKAKKAAQEQLAAEKEALEKTLPIHKLKEQAQSSPASGSTGSQAQVAPEPKLKERKDGSPVKVCLQLPRLVTND